MPVNLIQLTQKQKLILGLVVLGLFLFGYFLFASLKSGPTQRITLTVWGVEDDKDLWAILTKSYTALTGNEVIYVEKNPRTYEQELLNALAAGNGPDVFYFKNSWLLKHYGKITPASKSLFTTRSLEDNYPSVVSRDFTSGDSVYAIPLFIDTLALFYNPALLDQAAIPFPPKTWEELVQMTPKLTKTLPTGNFEYSAVALGTGSNISHSADILALLMIQSGSSMVDVSNRRANLGSQAQTALSFYTQFSRIDNQSYSWNYQMADSLDEFAKSRVAMVFAYSRDIPELRKAAPYLNFKITTMPQPASSSQKKNYADYWGLAVSKQSRHAAEAWNLVSKVTEAEQAKNYAQHTNLAPARRALINQFRNTPQMETFTEQAFTAVSWPQPDASAITQLFTETIDNFNSNRLTLSGAQEYLEAQINRLFD